MLRVMFALEILFMLLFPIGLWLLIRRRQRVSWSVIVAGGVTFIASQVIHIPLNQALGLLGGERGIALWPTPLLALVAGLSAGFCEEVARYLVLRFWQRDARSWGEGVAFGAGHGGVEAILTGFLVLTSFVSMVTLQTMEPEALGVPEEMMGEVQAQVEAFWSTPWYLPLLGALERAFAITMHIAWSLLVMRALTQKNLGWLGAAILAHALVDALAVGLMEAGWAPLAVEGVLFLLALGSGGIIFALRPSPGPALEEELEQGTPP